MPFPHEHAARLRDPEAFVPGSFRRSNGKFGPGIDPIFGRLKTTGKMEVQTIRFSAERFTAAQARAWLKRNGYRPIEFEEATMTKKAKAQATQEAIEAEELAGDLIMAVGGSIEIEAGKDKDGKEEKRKRFKMAAYNGGLMELGGWGRPVVVDLEGMSVPRKSRPILLGHDSRQIVGHSDKISVEEGKLRVEGFLSEHTNAGQEVAALGAEGFPWQASIGARAVKVVRKDEGETVTVNGQEFVGPVLVVRKSVLGEVSFVPLGADDSTSATVAASAAGAKVQVEQETVMPKTKQQEQEVEANGTPEVEMEAPVVETRTEAADPVAGIRAEHARIAAINAACKDAPEIAAQAVKEGWTVEKAELHAVKAAHARKAQDSQVASPAIIAKSEDGSDLAAMKAGVLLASGKIGEKEVIAAYGQKAVEQGDRFRRLKLREMLAVVAARDGVQLLPGMSEKDWVRAAFSSISVSELLNDSATKTLLAAYNAVPSAARVLAKALSANDFKVHKGVRLTGDLIFKKVESGGEITHGTLGESSYSYSVDTFGRMIGLTRQDLKNDDLGAFLTLPQMFGRGSALAVEQAFWTLVLANTGSFFSGGNANYQSGASTALSIDSLSAAEVLLAEMEDDDGNPVLVQGRYLVVPPALNATARQIYVSTNLVGGTSSVPEANIHSGKYEPVMTPYLKSAAKAWYLFGDPADVAAFGIAWLDGVQTPTVEEVEVGPEYLGRAWRGYIDFGVCQIDKRGAVKSKGEA